MSAVHAFLKCERRLKMCGLSALGQSEAIRERPILGAELTDAF